MKKEMIDIHMSLGRLVDNPYIVQFWENDRSCYWKTQYVHLLFKSYHLTTANGENEKECEMAFKLQENVSQFLENLWLGASWYHTYLVLSRFRS